MQIADKYTPQQIEAKWYDYWIENRLFHSEPDDREPFTVVIPPPTLRACSTWGTCSTTRCRTCWCAAPA